MTMSTRAPTALIGCDVCFLLMMLLLLPSCQANCVGVNSCSCELDPSGAKIIINCRKQNLQSVPAFINVSPDQEFYELTLEGNNITRVEDRAFSMLKVQRIVLSGNPIVDISSEAFGVVENVLTELVLGLSNTSEFPTSAMMHLQQLQVLEVTGYEKPSLPSGALTGLTNLQKLSLTLGKLQSLTESDFVSQQSLLLILDLCGNQFTEIPVAAINSLKRLSSLCLKENHISRVRASSFASLHQLQALDLSSNALTTEPNAFSGLEGHLQNLTMRNCHLVDQDLQQLKTLTSLVRLDISVNYVTSIGGLLGNMKSLQELQLGWNKITSITRSVYSVLSSSLLKLDLTDNLITEVSPDAFADLHLLQELTLDGALRLQLNSDSFASQQKSLKLLSLRRSNLSSSQWSSINNLTGLNTLWLRSCALGNIPDFTFRSMNRLETLDLDINSLTSITQRSLTGLENSLVKLYLKSNQLTTLDQCVFHQFTKIDIIQLQLTGNPLQCDCNMKWLHDRLQPLKTNPYTSYRVAQLKWSCDNLNGRLFVNLTDEDFKDCSSTTQMCENFVETTTTVSPPGDQITLTVVEVTVRSATLIWNVSEGLSVQNFKLRYRSEGGSNMDATELLIQPDARNVTLSGLTPATTYNISLETFTANGAAITSISFSTVGESAVLTQSQIQLILGLTLGVGLAILLIIITVIVVLVKKSQNRRRKSVPHPQMGIETKRFIKHADQQNTGTVFYPYPVPLAAAAAASTEDNSNNIIAQTLETMSDEEKFRLVNLLTTSRGSMDSLNDIISSTTNKRSTETPARSAFADSLKDKHVYEEIQDDYYEEIPTDETV